jgi:capsular exopolysaccharide synthesis family protein
MSNEIQLALNPGLQMQPAALAGGALGAAGSAPATPLQKVHRLLRGRYLLAIVLGLSGASMGAAAGFLSQKPAYRSDATIEVNTIVPRIGEDVDKVMVAQGAYIQKQMFKLKSERVVKQAMQNPKWKRLRPQSGPEAIADFEKNLTVSLPPRSTNLIQVSYSDDHKDSKDVVQVAVASVIQAFTELFGEDDTRDLDKKIEAWMASQTALNAKIDDKRRLLEELNKSGADDPIMINARDAEVVKLQSTVMEAEEMLKNAESDLKAAMSGSGQKPSVEDFARVDPTMDGYVKARNEQRLRYDSLRAQLGERHPAVERQAIDLKARESQMQTYADELSRRFVIRWKVDGTGGALITKDLTSLRDSVARLRETHRREAEKVSELRRIHSQIFTAQNEIREAAENVARSNDILRDLKFTRDHLNHMIVLSDGDLPVPDKDRRPIFAALGFMGGAGLPVGLLMLIGLFDHRYRYSDETGPAMSGLTLLGILPNLPDRLSDPEQAAIAAHCVHQIRTMLQINGGPEERRVFAVTSASPGDGKTSLTLALGLSYAACGTRTLLIDCDLIGAGLTSRMNVNAAEGVLEAIANRNLLQYVRSTDIADVALLPVGAAGNLHASTLSPAALRRLVEEAEKHFETILIDTGPILGSIEASLVCAAADAVVLTVARGQQRPMVEKSLSHLAAIGARLAGVVFNRAQAHDFERSISGVSMRSGIPNASRTTAASPRNARLGPVARSVASSVSRGAVDD